MVAVSRSVYGGIDTPLLPATDSEGPGVYVAVLENAAKADPGLLPLR